MFVLGDWQDAVFFDAGAAKKSKNFSLASPPIDKRLVRYQNISGFNLVRNDYSPGTSDQKRQKIYDYGEDLDQTIISAKTKIRDVFNKIFSEVSTYPLDLTPIHCLQRDIEEVVNLSYQDSVHPLINSYASPQPTISCDLQIKTKTLVHKPAVYINNKMATSGDATLFEEVFGITTLDNKKYDRVARIGAQSGDNETIMTLDINTELFPCVIGEQITVVLATSLAMDGSKESDKGWRAAGAQGESTVADLYDYVCHGKLYKFEDSPDTDQIKAYISFGGLLMAIQGSYKKLTPLRVDYLYLLIKK